MTPSSITVAALQLEYLDGEGRAERIARVVASVEQAPSADLLVLPELWDVGYFAFEQYAEAAHRLGDGPIAALVSIARDRQCTIVAGSVIERDGDALHNTAAVISPEGTIVGRYRKTNLFRYRSREGELLTPGDGPQVVTTPAGRLGLATCFDLRFPRHFEALREGGADILIVPAAWPAARREHWQVLALARAIETQTPIVAVNGTGSCEGVEIAGGSVITDGRGTVLASAATESGWLTATIDGADTQAWRSEFPIREAAVV